MSYSVNIVGRDKAKLKAALRAHQCADEEKSPHNGVPKVVCDRLCDEVDRARIYEWQERTYGLLVEASGSFHESGANHSYRVTSMQMVE